MLVEENFLKIETICIVYWIIVSLFYFLRLMNYNWYLYTSYGKLDSQPTEGEEENFLKKFKFLNFGISSKYHFTLMYFSGIIFNVMFNLIFSKKISILFILYEIHLIRRFIECLFLTKFSKKIIRFPLVLFGISFYLFTTLSFYKLDKNEHFNRFTILISIYFIFLNSLQTFHHFILKEMKKYSIPFGGLFKYVTCPHYFLEIMIYISFTFLINFRNLRDILLILILNFFVIFNLTLNSIKTHEVGKKKNFLT